MPVLLLIPLVILGAVLLALLLMPFALFQRWRLGSQRQRAVGWVVRANAWLLAFSLATFGAGAWTAGRWVPDALSDAAIGTTAGAVLGALAVALTRWDPQHGGLWFTPNRWVVAGVTAVVAARIGWSLWTLFGAGPLLDAGARLRQGYGGLLAVGGLLLGQAAVYTWALRSRLPPPAPSRLGRVLRGPPV